MTLPAAPAIAARNNGYGCVRLTWPAVDGATGYNLYRGSAKDDVNVLGRNEKQTVTVNATAGTFKLTYATQQTAAIAWNASAQDVEDALVALSNIALGDVHVTLVGSVYTVEFEGLLARTNVAQMTSDAALLTGGTHTATVATLVAGIGPIALTVTSPKYDTTVVQGTLYFYAVRAKSADGEGPASNQVSLVAAHSAVENDTPTQALRLNRG